MDSKVDSKESNSALILKTRERFRFGRRRLRTRLLHALALDSGPLNALSTRLHGLGMRWCRSFIVHVPQSYVNSTPTPVYFMFHGYTDSADRFILTSNLAEVRRAPLPPFP